MSSNTSLFLAFHKFHRTQGQIGVFTPVGGKGTQPFPCLKSSVIVEIETHGLDVVGRRLHTSSAMGHERKTCRSSFWLPHLLQLNLGIPLLSKLELTGIALFAILHKKSFSLGLVLMFHMSPNQSIEPAAGDVIIPSVIPKPYPVLVEYSPDFSPSQTKVSGFV